MAETARRRLRYSIAMSLDGFIAGPKGEYDWIVHDPAVDFNALFRQFDTVVMGRRTYDAMLAQGHSPGVFGMRVFVASTTMQPNKHPDVTILRFKLAEAIGELKEQPGKDIWLFGGGILFRSLLDAGLVDTVEVSVSPILLGTGIRLVHNGRSWPLTLKESKALPSGVLMLSYVAAPPVSAT
jgi:dihydrofolate reductase